MTAELRDAIEALADAVLRRHAGHVPVDVESVARREGLVYHYLPFGSLAGAYWHIDGGPSVAMVSSRHPEPVQRYSMAHELGHHLIDLHDRPEGWVQRLGLALPRQRYETDFHEAHEYFAASLLMPRSWILAQAALGGIRRELVADVARQCAVSKVAAAVRIEELAAHPRHQASPMYARLLAAETAAAARCSARNMEAA